MWNDFTGDAIYIDTNIAILAIEEGNEWLDGHAMGESPRWIQLSDVSGNPDVR
jgi:hypothetical protein